MAEQAIGSCPVAAFRDWLADDDDVARGPLVVSEEDGQALETWIESLAHWDEDDPCVEIG